MNNGNNSETSNPSVKSTGSTPVASQPQSTATKSKTPPPAIHENQPDPQTGFEKLELHYQKAIELKLLHYPYRVISKKLIAAGYRGTEMTVQQWFAKGGACHDTYEKMVAIRRAELDEQIKNQKDLIEQGTANALIIINKVLNRAVENEDITEQDAIAARDMLDRGGVPKQAKSENTNKFDTEGLTAMAAVIKGVLENPQKK